MKRIENKTISLLFSTAALIIAFAMNIVLLDKNHSISYFGQYGDYSDVLYEYDYEVIIPVIIGLIALYFGIKSKKEREKKGQLSFVFSLLAVVLFALPTWKLFFEFLKFY
ncbi:MAG: hypothetical protein N4A71_21675 [Carboxylicivirga sp.]|jgi:ABC-type transporter Mla maintaining outer membrane lipid asymmetry permease subunit MlaE|nr:hypothetical protein [Carboxylicivirga sp.]